MQNCNKRYTGCFRQCLYGRGSEEYLRVLEPSQTHSQPVLLFTPQGQGAKLMNTNERIVEA